MRLAGRYERDDMEYNMGPGRRDAALERRYLKAEQEAKALIERFKEMPDPTFDQMETVVHAYVRTRYLLEPEDELVDSLNVLGEMNLSRALGVPVPDLGKVDMEAKCGGTSAVMTKKILLIVALNRDLGITVPPDEAADITKVSELVEKTYGLYCRR